MIRFQNYQREKYVHYKIQYEYNLGHYDLLLEGHMFYNKVHDMNTIKAIQPTFRGSHVLQYGIHACIVSIEP